MRRIFLIHFFLALFIHSGNCQQIPIKYYSQKEGLPNSLIPAIYQDSRGELWFPTLGGGISRFNGSSFRNYDEKDGLSNLLVRAVTEDATGRMIFGTMGAGIFYLEKDTILKLPVQGIPKDIFSLLTDSNGRIWAATSSGLLYFDGNKIKSFSAEKKLPAYAVTFVYEDANGNIWFGYDEQFGLYKYSNDSLTKYDKENGFTNGRVLNTFTDSDKNTWVATFEGIYFIGENADHAERITGEGLPDYYVFDFVEPQKGLLLIATQSNGLLLFDSGSRKIIRSIKQQNGLKSMLVFRVFKDDENNIWISNWGDGVARIFFSGFSFYEESEGIPGRIIYSMKKTDDGLVCSGPDGLMVLRENKFNPYMRGLVNKPVITFLKDKNVLFCALEREFLLIENGVIRKFTDPYLQTIKGIVKDKQGIVYLAGWNGAISVFDGNRFNEIEDTLISQIRYYYCAFSDSKGDLWFGTWDGGLVHYDGNKWEQFKKEDGLPSEKITCITEDREGNIIAGTNGEGVVIRMNDKWKILDQSSGLPSNSVYSVAVDSSGHLWIGFQGSISKADLRNNIITNYSSGSGFEGDCMMGSILTEENNVWIGTNNYLWKFNPEQVIEQKNSLRVYIDELKVNYRETDLLAAGLFSYRQNKFSFSFNTTQINDNENVEYSFRLQGVDTVFSPLTKQNEITFHELPPGNYSFEVKACLNDSCSTHPARFRFTIYPPFWKTWWFIFTSVAVLLIAFRIYVYIREKKYKEKQKELERIVKLRTLEITNQKKIVEEKQKEILDSINYAQRIQYALLAHDDLLKDNLPEYFVLFLPKDIVSGDFYWARKSLSGRFFLAVCDSTGHGVPGAFMSLLNISFLNEAINEKGILSPDKVLDHVRKRLIEHISVKGGQDGMDAILISYERDNNLLTYAAAHNAPVLIREKEFVEMKMDKMPVGKGLKEETFNCYSQEMRSGDVLYLYTDGYADQFGGEANRSGGKKLKEKNLKRLLLELHTLPMNEQMESLRSYFNDWKGDLEQVDDICIIGLRWS